MTNFRVSVRLARLIVWKLDRLGRNLRHLVNIVDELNKKSIGFRVITGQGANIDTTTPNGKLVFGIFAALYIIFPIPATFFSSPIRYVLYSLTLKNTYHISSKRPYLKKCPYSNNDLTFYIV